MNIIIVLIYRVKLTMQILTKHESLQAETKYLPVFKLQHLSVMLGTLF